MAKLTMASILQLPKQISMCSMFGRKLYFYGFHSRACNSRFVKLGITKALSFNYREFSTPARRIMTQTELEKSLFQLDMDAKYKNRIYVTDIEHILNSLKYLKEIDFHQSLLLLRCCGSLSLNLNPEDRANLAHRVFSIIEEMGCKVELSHYNALLSAYTDNEYHFSLHEFIETLKSKGLEPNKVTFQRLLKAFCQQGDMVGASQLLEEMKAKKIPINEDVFNSLVYGHCQVNDIKGALTIIELMKTKGVEPTTETFINLISGYASVGDMEKITQTIEQCESKDMFFNDKDILSIIYKLAINEHESLIDNLLPKLKRNAGYSVLARHCVQQLLQKEKDLVALKIYSTIRTNLATDKGTSEDYEANAKFIIEYIVKYRNGGEILEFCKMLSDQGFLKTPLAITLREVLLAKNIPKAMKFFTAMKNSGISVRSHYFWPLLIDASREGNQYMIDVLVEMKNLEVQCCYLTCTKVVYPNYKFQSKWMDDIEKLQNCGVSVRILSPLLLEKFLEDENLEDAEKIATSVPMAMNKKFYLHSFVSFLVKTKNVDFFVNLMYWFLHDIHLNILHKFENMSSSLDSNTDVEQKSQTEAQYTLQRNLMTEIFRILTNKVDEDILVSILEKMLEKKILIDPKYLNHFLNNCQSDVVKNLVTELGDTNLMFTFDSGILEAKLAKSKIKEKEKIADIENQTIFSHLISLVENGQLEKAINLLLKIQKHKSDKSFKSFEKTKLKVFLMSLAKTGNYEAVQKAFQICVDMKALFASNFYPLVHVFLVRNQLEKATEIFCENVLKTGCVSSWQSILTYIIKAQNSELLQKVTDVLAKVQGEEFSISTLLCQLARSKRVNEIKKVLDGTSQNSYDNCIKLTCYWLLKDKSSEGLQTLLAASKNLPYYNKMTIYTGLLNLYIEERNSNEVSDLWWKMEEDNITPTRYFMEKMEQFYRDIDQPLPFMSQMNQKSEKLS